MLALALVWRSQFCAFVGHRAYRRVFSFEWFTRVISPWMRSGMVHMLPHRRSGANVGKVYITITHHTLAPLTDRISPWHNECARAGQVKKLAKTKERWTYWSCGSRNGSDHIVVQFLLSAQPRIFSSRVLFNYNSIFRLFSLHYYSTICTSVCVRVGPFFRHSLETVKNVEYEMRRIWVCAMHTCSSIYLVITPHRRNHNSERDAINLFCSFRCFVV